MFRAGPMLDVVRPRTEVLDLGALLHATLELTPHFKQDGFS